MQANECVIGDYRAAISRRGEGGGRGGRGGRRNRNRRYVFAMTLDVIAQRICLFVRARIASFRNRLRNRTPRINRCIYDRVAVFALPRNLRLSRERIEQGGGGGGRAGGREAADKESRGRG